MRIAVLTSTSLRHRYFVQTLESAFEIVAAFSQPKGNAYQGERQRSPKVEAHFRSLAAAEQKEFPAITLRTPVSIVGDMNDATPVEAARGADFVLLFGTSILKSIWLDAFPSRIINLHLGLSPFYRGKATLFWPAANNEIECMGSTIHLAAERVDAGAILRRVKADPQTGDDYYGLSTRLIRRSIDAIPSAVADYANGSIRPIDQDLSLSKMYRAKDFNEAALDRALEAFGNGLTADQIAAIRGSERCACSQ